MDAQALRKLLDQQDKQITELETEFSSILAKELELKPTEELVKLLKENSKLKYRIKILEQVMLSISRLNTENLLNNKFFNINYRVLNQLVSNRLQVKTCLSLRLLI